MKIVTTICWGVAALALAGIAVWFLTGTVFGFETGRYFTGLADGITLESLKGPYKVAGEYSVSADSVDSIKINWITGGITVTPYSGDVILITESAQRELSEGEKLRLGSSGGVLTIDFHEDRTILRMPHKKLDILVPEDLSKGMRKLIVDSVSGSVSVENVSAAELKVSSISGSLRLTDIIAEAVNIDSTSGSIAVSGLNSGDMSIRSISGAVSLSATGAANIKCSTTSSSIEMKGSFGSATVSTVSGRVAIESAIIPESLSVDTTSGRIDVTVPNEGAVSVYHSSTSGRFSSDLPVLVQGREAQFRFSTISGAVRIYELG